MKTAFKVVQVSTGFFIIGFLFLASGVIIQLDNFKNKRRVNDNIQLQNLRKEHEGIFHNTA
jgi:hypothetical protein